VYPTFSRAASSSVLPKGRAQILEKRPEDVVITFAKRTAVGRAKKGQLKDSPVDELIYAVFKVCFAALSMIDPPYVYS
jgi:hypothetical protein